MPGFWVVDDLGLEAHVNGDPRMSDEILFGLLKACESLYQEELCRLTLPEAQDAGGGLTMPTYDRSETNTLITAHLSGRTPHCPRCGQRVAVRVDGEVYGEIGSPAREVDVWLNCTHCCAQGEHVETF